MHKPLLGFGARLMSGAFAIIAFCFLIEAVVVRRANTGRNESGPSPQLKESERLTMTREQALALALNEGRSHYRDLSRYQLSSGVFDTERAKWCFQFEPKHRVPDEYDLFIWVDPKTRTVEFPDPAQFYFMMKK
jgi:hypothetical protein